MQQLQTIIEQAFEDRASITPNTVTPAVKQAVMETIALLDSGKLRVAEKTSSRTPRSLYRQKQCIDAILRQYRCVC